VVFVVIAVLAVAGAAVWYQRNKTSDVVECEQLQQPATVTGTPVGYGANNEYTTVNTI